MFFGKTFKNMFWCGSKNACGEILVQKKDSKKIFTAAVSESSGVSCDDGIHKLSHEKWSFTLTLYSPVRTIFLLLLQNFLLTIYC